MSYDATFLDRHLADIDRRLSALENGGTLIQPDLRERISVLEEENERLVETLAGLVDTTRQAGLRLDDADATLGQHHESLAGQAQALSDVASGVARADDMLDGLLALADRIGLLEERQGITDHRLAEHDERLNAQRSLQEKYGDFNNALAERLQGAEGAILGASVDFSTLVGQVDDLVKARNWLLEATIIGLPSRLAAVENHLGLPGQ